MVAPSLTEVITVLATFINTEIYDDEEPLVIDAQEALLPEILDSVGAVQLAAFMEAEFAVQFAPEDYTAENFSSLTTLAEFVCWS